jgi:hypothetical protein
LPRSAAQAEDMRLLRPLIKKPRKNIYNKRMALDSENTKIFRVKAIKEAKTTARKATGERLP